MDKKSLVQLLKKIWEHADIDSGYVFLPSITNIKTKNERFHDNGAYCLDTLDENSVVFDKDQDWYWTPAVSSKPSRKKQDYVAQKVLWVDCDDNYNKQALKILKPSLLWKTSPNHVQAIWLLKESVNPSEFHKDGLIGLLIDTVKADQSGSDISQLLRVPTTYNHKNTAFKGSILQQSFTPVSIETLIFRCALALGFDKKTAAYLSLQDSFGDRSKNLWKFEKIAFHLGLSEELTFKLLRHTYWNKWKNSPDNLRQDIHKAYIQEKNSASTGSSTESIDLVSDEDAELEEDGAEVHFTKITDFQGLAYPIQWLIKDIIPKNSCGFLIAPPKVGKTRLAVELLAGLASGQAPLGISIQHKIPTAFMSLEDNKQLTLSRLSKAIDSSAERKEYHWNGYLTCKDSLSWNPGKPLLLWLSFDPLNLNIKNNVEKLYQEIEVNKVQFVIIDTLSMSVGNANVNDSKDMYSILKNIKTISQNTGCSFMFIHHTRKNLDKKDLNIQNQILGSTALFAWSDFIIALSDVKDTDSMQIRVVTKQGSNNYYLDDNLQITNLEL